MADELVTIKASRLKYLNERDAFLTRLEAAGVDNWDGYHYGFGDDDEGICDLCGETDQDCECEDSGKLQS
jgi:hypothetical protein